MKRLIEQIRRNEFVDRLLREYGGQLKKVAILGAAVVILFAVFAFQRDGDNPARISEESKALQTEESSTAQICVDIGGAVMSPMLAQLPEGSRVEDAIQAAGGLKEDADMTTINRAEFLEDGEKIYIPCYERDADGQIVSSGSGGVFAASAGASAAPTSKSNTGKVNINTADSAALQTLNGVGPATAEKIIDYRTTSGRFASIEDLKNVSGIGDKTFEKLKDSITI